MPPVILPFLSTLTWKHLSLIPCLEVYLLKRVSSSHVHEVSEQDNQGHSTQLVLAEHPSQNLVPCLALSIPDMIWTESHGSWRGVAHYPACVLLSVCPSHHSNVGWRADVWFYTVHHQCQTPRSRAIRLLEVHHPSSADWTSQQSGYMCVGPHNPANNQHVTVLVGFFVNLTWT